MNLILDIGNTLSKVGLFEKNEVIEYKEYPILTVDLLKDFLIGKNDIRNSILATVRQPDLEMEDFLRKNFNYFQMNAQLPIPLRNLYKTPETLGHDRLALAVAAAGIFPNQNNLVIGVGTCITIDFVNAGNEYLGGAILPGMEMKFKALNTFTAKLPLLSRENGNWKVSEIGNDTNSSVLSGVLNGSLFEIQGFVEHYQKQYPQINVIFTGGGHKYFVQNVNFKNFAEANLVMKGLNIILNFNVDH